MHICECGVCVYLCVNVYMCVYCYHIIIVLSIPTVIMLCHISPKTLYCVLVIFSVQFNLQPNVIPKAAQLDVAIVLVPPSYACRACLHTLLFPLSVSQEVFTGVVYSLTALYIVSMTIFEGITAVLCWKIHTLKQKGNPLITLYTCMH